MIKQRNIIITVVIIGLLISWFLYQNYTKKQALAKTEKASVTRKTLKEELILSGSIDADEQVTLRFQTSGKLTYIGVKEGDYVKKGQLIARLDEREVRKKLEKELNDFLKTRYDLDQDRENNKDKAITNTIQRLLDKSQIDVNSSVLDVEIQDLAVQLSRLTSPIEGIVTMVKSPYEGVNITPTQAEFEIINPKTIYFAAVADQNDITKIYEGMMGELVLDSYINETIPGMIDKIAFTPKTDETGTAYKLKFVFNNNNDPSRIQYRIGMTGDLSLILDSKQNVLSLPNSFVKEEENKKYVFMEKKGKKEKIYIKTGIETDSDIEIVSGVREHDQVYDL